MNKIKNIVIAVAVIISGGLMLVVDVNAERSWDNKTEEENVGWKQEINLWAQAIEKWDEKRDNLHEQYYGDRYDDHAKYCDAVGCWEEGMFYLIFSPKNSSMMNLGKSDCGVKGDLTFQDHSTWECRNSGQVITYNSSDGEFWDSSNRGQVIEYKNTRGDYWASHNYGQTTEFTSFDGEKWESHNYGQVVEYTDKDGNEWSGSDDDDLDDMN